MTNKFKNNRFGSLIDDTEIKNNSNIFLTNNEKKPSMFSNNNYNNNNNNYNRNQYIPRNNFNSFMDPKIQKEKEKIQSEHLEKEKIKFAFNENNFTESLVKTDKILVQNENITPINFLEKARLAATKEVIKKPIVAITEQNETTTNQVDPFFNAYLNAVTSLYEKQEVEERTRLGDDLYEEKYGINDENYMDYFDMLDELAESDSDSDSDSDFE
jgi:hypothetical protein